MTSWVRKDTTGAKAVLREFELRLAVRITDRGRLRAQLAYLDSAASSSASTFHVHGVLVGGIRRELNCSRPQPSSSISRARSMFLPPRALYPWTRSPLGQALSIAKSYQFSR